MLVVSSISAYPTKENYIMLKIFLICNKFTGESIRNPIPTNSSRFGGKGSKGMRMTRDIPCQHTLYHSLGYPCDISAIVSELRYLGYACEGITPKCLRSPSTTIPIDVTACSSYGCAAHKGRYCRLVGKVGITATCGYCCKGRLACYLTPSIRGRSIEAGAFPVNRD